MMGFSDRVVVIGLLFILALALGGPLRAHGVGVDGDGADWTGTPTVQGGYDPQAGEWGWRASDPSYLLQEFRVTGDNLYLYCLVKLADVRTARGEGAPLLQIAVDTDQQPNSGQAVFPGFTPTRLAPGPANWERLIRTAFGAGRDIPAILDPNLTDLATRDDLVILSPQRRTVEMRVRWAALGVAPPTRLRLTVALFSADRRDNVLPEGSPALAFVKGSPGLAADRLDAYAEVAFRAGGDAVPPPEPLRLGRWEIPVPERLRDPLLYGALAGVLLIALGVLLKLRGRPRSWWWG
ncbi:MAG: hypothetical protein KIT87_11065 [Anaerolineae bacterium]|nr:hypothetical protein [Anaerolineae bacterium]